MAQVTYQVDQIDPTPLEKQSSIEKAPVAIDAVQYPGIPEVPDEVKAIVPETDDPDEPCESFRAYLLGVFWCVVGTGLNTWFSARQPGIYLSPFLAQVLSHPFGLFLARVLPTHKFNLLGTQCSFNPGPWTIKEHTIVVLMATVSLPTATALDIVVTTKLPVYFNDPDLGGNLGYQFLIILSTQFAGFGIAGLARDYLVYPSDMIWPINLAKVALFNALHRRKADESGVITTSTDMDEALVHGWKISAFRFCMCAMIGSFIWFWFTAFIAPFLTYFNWPTWIAPTNVKLNIIMGTVTGIGLNPLPTLDWTYISGAGLTPLITPWWATLQVFIGCSIGLFILIGLYFSNTWYSSYLVPNYNGAFDRFGLPYNVTRVLNPDKSLNLDAYKEYSPLYFSAGYNLVIGAYFASYTALVVYAALEHLPALRRGFRTGVRKTKAFLRMNVPEADQNQYDIHYQLMQNYKDLPQWWFAAIAAISIVMGIIACEMYKTTMPVWGIFVAMGLAVIFLIPSGIVMALSNIQLGLVILAEVIPGVAIPGRPYANMIFKIYGWIALAMAQLYVQDQKLAHYVHVPPRATFRAQMIGCLIGTFVTIGTINWQMSVISDLCVPGQKDLLTCPYLTSFFSSALLFGVVGPTRVYGAKGLYNGVVYCFLIGALLPLIAWAIKRKWPNKITKTINIPIILTGFMYFAPYNWSFVWSGVPLAWLFMSFIYKRYHAWWNKYTYVLSIGLTVGVAVCGVVQFFCVTYPGGKMPKWWGNTFYVSGCDGLGCPLKPMPDAGYFGPGPGGWD